MHNEPLYQGKAKTLYKTSQPDELIVVFRDDITAFNGEKHDILKDKGRFNAAASAFFMELLGTHGIQTHFVRMDDNVTMRVKHLSMIPLEIIIRNRAAGSMVRRYPVVEGTVFQPPIITIDYKDDKRGDPMMNDEIICGLGILTPDELLLIKEKTRQINTILSGFFDGYGISLIDFKIEFGRYNKDILLGDEISMDSMRLWDAKTGESLDKDVYRLDKGDVITTYRKLLTRIIPKTN